MNLVNAWLDETAVLSASERQQYIDAAGYLPDYLLSRYDRMSMSVSLELRVPILDHRIVEFAFCLPPAMKACGPRTKSILRRVLGRHVPEVLFQRKKTRLRRTYGTLDKWASSGMGMRHDAQGFRPSPRCSGSCCDDVNTSTIVQRKIPESRFPPNCPSSVVRCELIVGCPAWKSCVAASIDGSYSQQDQLWRTTAPSPSTVTVRTCPAP